MGTFPMKGFPLWAEVDVVVIGGAVAGCAAAIAARGAGARVAVLAERTFVGDDIAGTFELWPGAPVRHPLACAIWPDDQPSMPLHAKGALEDALLGAGCDYLLGSGLTHVLRDAQGRLAGVLVATSGGVLAVAARILIDATRHGLVAAAAGHASSRPPRFEAGLVVLGDPPPGAQLLGNVTAPSRWLGGKRVDAWRVQTPFDADAGEAAGWGRAESDLRARVFTPGQLRAADLFTWGDAGESSAHWLDDALARAVCDARPPAERFAEGERIGVEAARRADALTAARPIQAVCRGGVRRAGLGWLPEAPRFAGCDHLELEGADVLPSLGAWDVAVLGGGTSGAPAALAAAREGVRTLVVEAAPGLGGVGTQGMIGAYFAGYRGGFTRQIDLGVAAMGEGGYGPDEGAWNVEWKAAWYLRELRARGADVWFGVRGAGCLADGGVVRGFAVTTPWGAGAVDAGVSIDAGGSASLAAAARAPVNTLGADHVAVQGSGLGPRELTANHRNNDWTFVDDGDPVDLTRAFVAARSKWRGEFDVAQIVDMRERRRLRAEYDLDLLDILAERTFPDTIAQARAPFETHGLTIHPVFFVQPPPGKEVLLASRIPLRALLPRGLEGLLVVGLGIGAHRDAVTVIRMQADVQNTGWAAGLCAVLAVREHSCRVRAVSVRALQRRLVDAGSVPADVLEQEDSFPVSDARLQEAVAGGLADHRSLALVFAHLERARPLVRTAFETAHMPALRQRLAVCLGVMGDAAAADALAEHIDASVWDEGWTFAGMEQWGHSLSPLDGMLIALGRTGARRHASVVARKMAELGPDPALSHARAVALAAAGLGDPALAGGVQRLLELPGVSGHHQARLAEAARERDPDPNANRDRNAALRELFLARALWQLGDPAGVAGRILRAYAEDLRGHFSRHAGAVLAEPAGSAPGWDALRRANLA
ncbi:MAG TPA: FAD-dependent oxidoreductase [Kiritimatiellia bacterium]|nr:FAD-dependent oxidoreductase [Kiritimatiellia bacterium]